jgi:7-cyano-7-deazaguanine synthase in queuosine biosynthesis
MSIQSRNPVYRFHFSLVDEGLLRAERSIHCHDGGASQSVFSVSADIRTLRATCGMDSIPPDLSDFLTLAACICVADRLSPRNPGAGLGYGDDHWTRNIQVEIPLHCPERWNDGEVIEALEGLCHWLTGDKWSFDFKPIGTLGRYCQRVLPSDPFMRIEPDATMLYSGGLDSAIGLVNVLNKVDAGRVWTATVLTNTKQKPRIDEQIEGFRTVFRKREILMTTMHLNIHYGALGRDDRESSYRSRGFLFLAFGLVVARLAKRDLTICENGIGALAIPMTPDHLGPRASKSVHPRTLGLISAFFRRMTESDTEIDNQGLAFTKTQLLSDANELIESSRLLDITFSCDQFPYLTPGQACGTCSSCLLRQLAFSQSGLEDGFTRYQFPIKSLMGSEKSLHFSAMGFQSARLKSVLSRRDDLNVALGQPIEYVVPYLPWSSERSREILTQLFSRHVREFDAFQIDVESRKDSRPGISGGTYGRIQFIGVGSENMRTPGAISGD